MTTADIGLAHEAAMIRAAIRRLATDDDPDHHVTTFAELRRQAADLCAVLDGRGQNAIAAAVARALSELDEALEAHHGRA